MLCFISLPLSKRTKDGIALFQAACNWMRDACCFMLFRVLFKYLSNIVFGGIVHSAAYIHPDGIRNSIFILLFLHTSFSKREIGNRADICTVKIVRLCPFRMVSLNGPLVFYYFIYFEIKIFSNGSSDLARTAFDKVQSAEVCLFRFVCVAFCQVILLYLFKYK